MPNVGRAQVPERGRSGRPSDVRPGKFARGDRLTVFLASHLPHAEVARIASVAPRRLRVIHEPDLFPGSPFAGRTRPWVPDWTDEQLSRLRRDLASCDVLFDLEWIPTPAQLPQMAPRLCWVQATSSGIGGLLREAGLLDTGIVFTTAAGVHGQPLAEFVLLGLLYFAKGVDVLRAQQQRHHWEYRQADELAGQRVLIVGLGQVGSAVARACHGLGMEVWATRRSWSLSVPAGVDRLVPTAELRTALGQIDALVLACPYTPETHHLIDRSSLNSLRRTAILVNVARGAVVDEDALVDALRVGRIRGAAMDVFTHEPLALDSPLWDLPNVLISPHSAGLVAGEATRIVDLFVDNLRRYLSGRSLRNVFDPERGY